MPLSTYLDNKIITDNLTGTLYVALHTAEPGNDGTNAEITTGGVTRKACTFAEPTNGSTTTATDLEWVGISFAGTITHASVWDAASGGHCLMTGELTDARTIIVGNEFRIYAGSLTVRIV